MDPKIAARFHPGILARARERYSIPADSIRLLDGFESFMYEFERPDGGFILRLAHSLRRSPDLICGEVHWINYLYEGGVNVAQAVLSDSGNLVEQIDDDQGGLFLATAFLRAPGGHPAREHLTDRMFINYGRLLGRMHRLAKRYILPDPAWKRPEWDSPQNIPAKDWFPEELAPVPEIYGSLMAHLTALPKDPDSYGMIHQDAHTGNLFVDEHCNLTLFDFDDCVYGHFIYDLAMVLFYISMWDPDTAAFTTRFMPIFLRAYREENRLDPVWLKEMPHFIRLREIDLFAQIMFSVPDAKDPKDPWIARFMRGRRERIIEGIPFIDFDFGSLAGCL